MPRSLLSLYPRKTDRFDEMLAAGGDVRPAWSAFIEQLDAATPEQMHHRLNYVRQRVLENGVTYNVYADPEGTDRPWELDPIPLILSSAEWQSIAHAVKQRARLLNAMLGDLYGEQTLVREGKIPAALVFGHNGFLGPCQEARPPGATWLHLYAADLVRSPDGRWWVIADRTQAPSGAGYALENRLIVSRVFPEPFRDLRVQHLADFFAALQDTLAQLAPADGEPPLTVLLTPGPYNETYFEHAYLARYLGYPLVEGQDLTVRGECVYLKTLSGLKRVHAILRRLDDDYCDPLELRGDSALGVAGLLQAVRAGKVLVANALGSGLLESTALPGFLPGACAQLLGETLAMPSVGTWWCGEPAALDFVVEHLDTLVIKGTFPSQRMEPIFGSALAGAARDELIARLRATPQAYVAQELVAFSQAPAWSTKHDRRLLPRGVALRVYAAATADGYTVMPGGLTRVAAATDARTIAMQRGGSSKDTWILSDKEVSSFSLLKRQLGKADLIRSGSNLSSRVVENLYWFGRYSERCEDTARLLRVGLSRLVDAGTDAAPALTSAIDLCRTLKLLPGGPRVGEAHGELAARLLDAICETECEGSVADNIHRLLWVGTQVRERFSLDNWYALNRLQRQLQRYAKARPEISDALVFVDQMLLASASLAGFAMDNMTRDDGWRFLLVGRRIERLIFLCEAIGGFLRLESTRAPGSLDWLLELTDSIITYRSRYMAQPELLPTLDLILFDDANPHGVLFQLQNLSRYLARLDRELGNAHDEPLLAARVRLQRFDLACLEGAGASTRHHDELAGILEAIAACAAELSDRLAMRYFTHIGDVGRQTLAA